MSSEPSHILKGHVLKSHVLACTGTHALAWHWPISVPLVPSVPSVPWVPSVPLVPSVPVRIV